ncbi:MAG: hypothetical protein ACI91F_000432 [Candidatus Binatia bacterium]
MAAARLSGGPCTTRLKARRMLLRHLPMIHTQVLPLRVAALTIAATLLVATPALEASAAPPNFPGSVLLIGNSFLRGIRRPLVLMFRERGHRLKIKQNGPNAWTLAKHVASRRTQKRINKLAWDVIVLQELADRFDTERYADARILDQRIKENGAETMFFMTWRDRGEPLESFDSLRGEPGGSEGYVPIADELGARIAPVGWAVRDSLASGLPYDLWRDGHHLNGPGRYLAACVFFAALTGDSPVGNYGPRSIPPSQLAYIQQLAADTVLDDPSQWYVTPATPE